MVLVMLVQFSPSALAYSATWHQVSGFDYVPSSSINSAVAHSGDTVIFEGVAYGTSGRFGVRLQSRSLTGDGSFTDVIDVSWRYVTPTTGQTYNTSTGQEVDGKFFRLYWNIPNTLSYLVPREYRVVLLCVGTPHTIELRDISVYKQAN